MTLIHKSPFSYEEAINELRLSVQVSMAGLELSSEAVRFAHVAQQRKASSQVQNGHTRTPHTSLSKNALKEAEQVQAFARQQMRDGGAYFFGLATIRLWGIMEAMVDDFVFSMLEQNPKCRETKTIRALEAPVVEFWHASATERIEILLAKLKQETKARLKVGVGRFESLLDAIGISGPVDDSVRKALLELSQIRNVLVHKSGIVDDRLVEQCPWLQLSIGTKVHVKPRQFDKFCFACDWYAVELTRRQGVAYGQEYKAADLSIPELSALLLQRMAEASEQ